jgi:hypothetical protein
VLTLLSQGAAQLYVLSNMRPDFNLTTEDEINKKLVDGAEFLLTMFEFFCPKSAVQRPSDDSLEVDLTSCQGIGFSQFTGKIFFSASADLSVNPKQATMKFELEKLKGVDGVALFSGNVSLTVFEGSLGKRPDIDEDLGFGVNGTLTPAGEAPLSLQADGWMRLIYRWEQLRPGKSIPLWWRFYVSSYTSALVFGKSDDVRVTVGISNAEIADQAAHQSACPLSGVMTITADHRQIVTFADASTTLAGQSRNVSEMCGGAWKPVAPTDLTVPIGDGGFPIPP